MANPNPLTVHTELSQSVNSLSKASERFDATQRAVNEDLVTVVEKVAFYSAGIISLSITFVGTLIDNQPNPIKLCVFGVPLMYSLFVAWSLLLVSFLSGLFVRWYNSRHLYFVDGSNYHGQRQKFHQAQENYLRSGQTAYLPSGSSHDDYSRNLEKLLEIDKEAIGIAERNNKKVVRWKTTLQYVCFTCFIAGIVILTVTLMSVFAVG